MIIAAIASPFILFVLYLAYCSLRVAHSNGKLAAAPMVVKAVAWMVLLVMIVADFLFNVTLGALVFWELPWGHGKLFTGRCASHRFESGRRGQLARWVCDGWLNPFEAGHC